MANYNRISETVFNKAKALLNAGKSPLETANYCGISRTCAGRIRNTETFSEWVANTAKRVGKTTDENAITRTKITENIFRAVKIILDDGRGTAEAAEIMGISRNSVLRIAKANNYVEYVNNTYIDGLKQKPEGKPETEKTPETGGKTIVVQASHYMLEEQKRTNELLASISKKLAFIVEELGCNKPEGTGENAEPHD